MIDKIKQLGICGLTIKGYGSPGVTTFEAGVILFELRKREASVGGVFLVHNVVSMITIDKLGDEE